MLPGFGQRFHPSGRKSYVLQRTMDGKQRLITIGDVAILTERIAKNVARRLILRVELGQNPADEKQRGRTIPKLRGVPAILLEAGRTDLETIDPRDS